MASFTGIRNENEFYFAHYLSSLMDDDLRAGASEDLAAAVDRFKGCSDDWYRWRTLRERFLRETPDRDDRAEMSKLRNAAWRRIASALGWTGDLQPRFSIPGATAEFSAIPALGLVRTAASEPAVLLVESFRSENDLRRRADPTLLANRVATAQLDPLGIPLDAQQAFTDPNRHSGTDTPTWEWLLSHEIFSADSPVRPRFVLAFCETALVLLDRTKWAERRSLVFDLDEIFASGDRSSFRAASLLLSRAGLCPDGAAPLPDRLEENSHRNAFGVSKSLRVAMRDSVELLGNAILDSSRAARRSAGEEAAGGSFTAAELSRECITVMYRFLFVLFLESRRDIDYFPKSSGAVADDIFWSAYGFDHLRDLESVPLLTEEARAGTYFDETVKQLFAKIWNGVSAPAGQQDMLAATAGFSLPPLKAHLFDPARTPLFNTAVIPNGVWQKIVYKLSIGSSGNSPHSPKGRISYARLGIQQLGAVYEALLSYTGFYAPERLFEVRFAGLTSGSEPSTTEADDEAASENDNEADETESNEDSGDATEEADREGRTGTRGRDSTDELFETGYFVTEEDLPLYDDSEIVSADGHRVVHEKGEFIYRMAGHDRDDSASFYTPAELSRCLVRHALAERVSDDMKAADILRLTVCEPAMGSAAFLNEVVDQLADLYLDRAQKERKKTIPLDRYAAEKARVKMVIADNNVYGVDLNPTAADLAEVSLWLGTLGGESIPTGQDRGGEPYIPWFGTQLRCGNSVIGARREVVLPDGTRKALRFSDPLPDGAVWHFLLPDPAMGKHADKVVRGLLPDETKAMAAWSKAFNKAAEEACADSGSDSRSTLPSSRDRLEHLTRALEDLWQQAAKDAEQLEETTRDDVAYFGHETAQCNYSDIPAKDGLAAAAEGSADDLRDSSAARRLRMILDAWCALWFWPLDKAADLPSWDEWLDAVELVATGLDPATGGGDLFSFFAAQAAAPERHAAVAEFAKDPTTENLARLHPFTAVAHDVAAGQRFLHWELDFADVFRRRGGFDLVIGNPPWVKLVWNEGSVLSVYDPRIDVRRVDASDVAPYRDAIFKKNPVARTAYFDAYISMNGQKSFLSADSNYPELSGGVQPDLFRSFIPLAFRIVTAKGVVGYIHPEGIYDDPKGGHLRSIVYPRLRLHAQFRNELKLFPDVYGRKVFSLNVYGPRRNANFQTVSSLFHPNTLEVSLAGVDSSAPLFGERGENGKWNTTGHPDRIVSVDEKMLDTFAKLYDKPGTPALQARLPSIYTRRFLTPSLLSFLKAPKKLSDFYYGFSTGWDETNHKRNGVIKSKTCFVPDPKKVIYSGPIFFVGTPIAKCPRPNCRSKADYDGVDFSVIPDNYRTRMNYVPGINDIEYAKKVPVWNGVCITQFWRVFCRKMVNASNERTLIPCLISKEYLHINGVVEFAFEHARQAALVSGCWSTIPFDWFVRNLGKANFRDDVARMLPILPDDPRIRSRSLLLNCLTSGYADLWTDAWDPAYAKDGWLSADSHLSGDAFSGKTKMWNRATPIRRALDRRQALVELDVLSTRALGLSLEDLYQMYRINFPTMRKYDRATFYDQNGRIVFSPLVGSGGLNNTAKTNRAFPQDDKCTILRDEQIIAENVALGWKDVAKLGYDQPGIEIRHTIYDQVFSDIPSPHTVSYVAPFFRKDREADYREVWEALDKQEGTAK